MKPLEVTYLLLNLPLLAWCLLNLAIPSWTRIVPAVTLLFMAIDIAIEGARWTMAPAIVVTLWLFVGCTGPRTAQPGRWSGLAMIGLLLTAGMLETLLPVFELPKPTGGYLIGTVTRHLSDSSRKETQGDTPGGPRELMIQIWYPTDQAGSGQAYRTHDEVTLLKQHLAIAQTHATPGVPVAGTPSRFPLLLFAPSWTGRRNQNTVQAEELASHGFIVVGIDHPYCTDLTIFPDGRRAHSTLHEFMDWSSDETVAACVRVANAQLNLRTADARFVLDEIEHLNRNDPDGLLTGRIDTERVGIFGHSFGGAVAAEACRTDARFKAGANYDGLLFGDVLEQGIGKPFLFMMDTTPAPTDHELATTKGPSLRELILVAENVERIRYAHPDAVGHWASVKGASHMNFCDSPLYTPLKRLSYAGPISTSQAMHIINAYTLSFFNTYLNDKDDHLLDAPVPQYPEVEIESLYTSERTSHYVKAQNQLVKEHP
jgi:predicted dienelactone hydrolase